jgi:hypothetical protein
LLIGRCQHPLVNGPSIGQQPASGFLRSDPHSSCCNH